MLDAISTVNDEETDYRKRKIDALESQERIQEDKLRLERERFRAQRKTERFNAIMAAATNIKKADSSLTLKVAMDLAREEWDAMQSEDENEG